MSASLFWCSDAPLFISRRQRADKKGVAVTSVTAKFQKAPASLFSDSRR